MRMLHLGLFLETNGRIDIEQVRTMNSHVSRNTVAMKVCQNLMTELQVPAKARFQFLIDKKVTLQEMTKEVTLQPKNLEHFFVTKIENEKILKETLNETLEKNQKLIE